LKPGVDHTKYKKFMVDYVVFALADDSEYKGINGDEMKKLGDAASLSFVNALKEKYPIVPVAGFLPLRSAFCLTWNLPKPETRTSSPDASLDFMISRTVSTVSDALCLVKPLPVAIASIIPDLVSVIF